MSEQLPVRDVVFDESIYPRAEWSQATINRYAEALDAGDEFPPIVLEPESNRLWDGVHRLYAHRQALRETIAVMWQEKPEGVPDKVFAASFSTKHGDRITGPELQAIAREVAEENPDYDLKTLARYFGVTRQTVSKWVGDIVERRRAVRKLKAMLLSRAGWSQTQVAKHLGVGQASVSEWLSEVSALTSPINEEMLREASEGMPDSIDVAAIVEEIRQERIFASWSDEERDLLKRLRDGETVVVTLRGQHNNLIEWADDADLYMRIDRRTEWGNPFEMPIDGDRKTVIANFERYYLPHKPSLLGRLGELRGRVLGCWCAPEACHGNVLKARAEE